MPVEPKQRKARGRGRHARPSEWRLRGWIGTATAAVISIVLASSGSANAVPTSSDESLTAQPVAGAASVDSSFSHGSVTVDGIDIHFVRGGSGPAILLIHGWPQTWWEWHDVMPGLAQHHTVIAVDLPGLGLSDIPTSGYDKATTARRLHTAMVTLGLHDVTVIGHDVGALIAYPYARDFPEDVNRVVIIETPLPGFGLEDIFDVSFHLLFNMSPRPIPETILDTTDVSTYHGMIFDFSVNREAIDRTRYFLAYSDPSRRQAGYEYYRAFPADAADNLANAEAKRLTMPVIGMGGEFSFGPGVAASLSQVADDVRTVIAPGTGHFVPEENPQFLIDCVGYFLGDLAGPPPPALAGCAA